MRRYYGCWSIADRIAPAPEYPLPALHLPALPDADADPAPFLAETAFFDIGHPGVQAFVRDAVAGAQGERERAVALFYAVRDRIRYDPYGLVFDAPAYRASSVLAAGRGWCVPKAGLLAACARAAGIASAVGLADVVNHLNTEKLRATMGTDVFYDHGYTALRIEGRWVKAVPAFNIELCRRFGVQPTEFDGRTNALYQEHDAQGRRHMQYLADHGTWSDMPLDQVIADFAVHYPGISERARASASGESSGADRSSANARPDDLFSA
jgi:transglutaminase-like putative cysteine protease